MKAGHFTMRTLLLLFSLMLFGWTLDPASAFSTNGSGLQGWAFEMRDESVRGWVGAWTPGRCEELRRDALEEHLGATIGACHSVTLTDEPSGVLVWAVLVSDSHFVAASSSDICDEEAAPPDSIRPVSMAAPVCQRLWIRAAG